MKKLSSLLLIVLSLLLFTSCRKKIEGSGRFITINKSVREFTQVESAGNFTIYIKEDTVQSLLITGEDNIIPHIVTHVNGTKLKLYFDDVFHNYDDNGITIYITVPRVDNISLLSSGKIKTIGTMHTPHLTTALSGSGSLDITLESATFNALLTGSGDITIHGMSVHAEHFISGSGTIQALDLLSKEAEVNISGSGNCNVHVTDHLRAQISGSGDIRYIGSPVVESSISGSGSVRPY